jgi:hypothetical protein
MTLRYTHLALVAAVFWISQTPSGAQTCADAIRVPFRSQTCDGQSVQGAMSVSYQEAHAHIITAPYVIHSAIPEDSRVELRVIVAPSGAVASATPFSGNPQWYEKATALATTWRFTPFQRQGAAIYAKIIHTIHIAPPEKRPEQHTPFPEINDWDSVRITLQRSGCRACPAYKVMIFGDGRVLFSGYTVDYGGEYHGRVSHEVVRQLVDLFSSADYFNLFDRYGRAYDAPSFTTSISFDGNSKSVVDEVGYHAGMPEVVTGVEDGIDRLAGPRVWAKDAEAHRQRW